ncbi:Kinase, NEK [Giardia muris]|uniref:Kinase, NEK n=1 Tax=Giardia muris TaxID=5742 RepID=A0A4Z1SLQ7_GIAMU|nr:Kinase, NEK [Giardia muris]|eukprot:TNJ26584.1 Kinase, NEK [Giardia muris]
MHVETSISSSSRRHISHDEHTGRRVVITTVDAHELSEEDRAQLVHTLRKLRYAISPHILRLLGAECKGETVIIKTEYAPGGSLRDQIVEFMMTQNSFSEDECWMIFTHLMYICSYVHQFTSRMSLRVAPLINPSTLFFSDKGNLMLDLVPSVIYDFLPETDRLAQKLAASSDERALDTLYTDPGEYVAPELFSIDADSTAFSSVVYSAGAVMLELLFLSLDLSPSDRLRTRFCTIYHELPEERKTNSFKDIEFLQGYERWTRFFQRRGVSSETRLAPRLNVYTALLATCTSPRFLPHLDLVFDVLTDDLDGVDPICENDGYVRLLSLANRSRAWYFSRGALPISKPLIYANHAIYSPDLLATIEACLYLDPEERLTLTDLSDIEPLACINDEVRERLGADDDNCTDIMRAAMDGDVDLVQQLAPAQSRYVDGNGWTALMHAITSRAYDAALTLANWEAGAISTEGITALRLCLEASSNQEDQERCLELAQRLLPLESEIRYEEDKTLLMLAVEKGNLEMCRLLADYEAGLCDLRDRPASAYALRDGAADIFRLLLPLEREVLLITYTPLMLSAAANDLSAAMQIMRMVSGRASVGQFSNEGWTALMIAAHMDSREVAVLLSFYETRLQASHTRLTALMFAIRSGHSQVAATLLDKEMGLQSADGCTALMYAAEMGMGSIAMSLVRKEGGAHDLQFRTTLMRAAEKGDEALVSSLLRDESCIVSRAGDTALMLAVKNRQMNVIPILAKREAGIRSKTGVTASMYAAEMGWVPAALLLIRLEAGYRTENGETATDLARKNGHESLAQDLEQLETFERLEEGLTPLIIAALRNTLGDVQSLGYQSQLRDAYGKTALMAAVENGNFAAAQYLLESEVGMQDYRGHCALYYAIFSDPPRQLMRVLLEREIHLLSHLGFSRLMRCILLRNPHIAKERMAEVGTRSVEGYTALMMAALTNNASLVRVLSQKEMRAQTTTGMTALMYAAERGYVEVARHLATAESGLRAEGGWTALMLAARAGHAEIVEALIPYEARLQDDIGCTALFRAVQKNQTDVVRLLAFKEAGCVTNSQHPRGVGWTALLEAAHNGWPNSVVALLDAEIQESQRRGFSVLRSAAEPWPSVPRERRLLCVAIVREYFRIREGAETAGSEC